MGLLKLSVLFVVVLMADYTYTREVDLNLSWTDGSQFEVTSVMKLVLPRMSLHEGTTHIVTIIPPRGVYGDFLQIVLKAAKATTIQMFPWAISKFNARGVHNLDGTTLDLSWTNGSQSMVTKLLKSYLSRMNLHEGMKVVISVIPPNGATDSFLQTVLNAANDAVTDLLPYSAAQFNASAGQNRDGTLYSVNLEVNID